jgi:putative endonuclease
MKKPRNRYASEKRGRGAETHSARWLRQHGRHIIARRARVPGGEVDIVARRGRTLAFVEVKARATDDAAAFSLDAYRLRRVAVAAERLSRRFMRAGDEMRIDAIFIVPRRWPRHLPNIWQG